MRPTWHFVAPDDLRWLLQLTKPRVHAMNEFVYRLGDLDPGTRARGERVLERALSGGNALTRAELAERLAKDGIKRSGIALAYIVMHAELEGLVCSGPRRGKQFTYALLDERVPAARPRTREEALLELTRRYFSTRGPATAHDFSWWSGLTVKECRAGIEMAVDALAADERDGVLRWSAATPRRVRGTIPPVLLLPTYDELGISYKDRSAMPAVARPAQLTTSSLLPNILVVGGQMAGRWGRTLTTSRLTVDIQPFMSLTARARKDVEAAANAYAKFVGRREATTRFV